jgi:hypothetical protein
LLEIVAKHAGGTKGHSKPRGAFGAIAFDEDPISFLLLLSDSLQEQGRSDILEDAAELQKLYSSDGNVFAEVSFSGPKAGTNYDRKVEELNTLRKHVTSEGRFVLIITSITDGGDGATETRATRITV